MDRRNFLGAMLGAMAAPAIVRAESLMKIVVPKKEIILPRSFARGVATAQGGELKKFMGRGMSSPIWTADEESISLSLMSTYKNGLLYEREINATFAQLLAMAMPKAA